LNTLNPTNAAKPNSPAVHALIERIVPGASAVSVPTIPRQDAIDTECFANVSSQVTDAGGLAVFGWSLYEWPGVLAEGEFHAIWRSPLGGLVDVSPQRGNDDNILFLPDPNRLFEGRQIDNIRIPLRPGSEVREFIAVSEAIFGVLNAGERADAFGLISIPTDEIRHLLLRKAELQSILARQTPSRNSPCPCGSGKKFKRCCAP
jgi:hypothetical protein